MELKDELLELEKEFGRKEALLLMIIKRLDWINENIFDLDQRK